MAEKLRGRFIFIYVLLGVLFVLLIATLFNLTIVHGDEYAAQASTRKTRIISVAGKRGTIYDANGIPLAYDETSYSVSFYKDPTKTASSERAHYTDIILQTIKIIENNGGAVIDTFNIVKNDNGTFAFDFGITNPEHIAAREVNWRKNMYISETATPEEIYYSLRERYRIPESMTYEETRTLLSVWQEVQLSAYRSYIPVKIAENVNEKTVAIIEARALELSGVSIDEETTRVYPRMTLAAHSIGYLGNITDETALAEYKEQGYDSDDLVGITGIEATMEQYLTGQSKEKLGTQVLEVSTSGQIINEISSTPATNGYNVITTINSSMQTVLEDALESNVKRVHEKQLKKYADNKEAYEKVLKGREPNLAVSGSAVVMNVKTGDILAIASYPSYDLNLFTGGVDEEVYKALLEDTASPLFNKAISSKSIPGSVFKMVTAIGGLMEGKATLTETISDESPFNNYVTGNAKGPACWTPDYAAHANLNLVGALRVSCNYYFFTIADRLGIDKVVYWAEQFGLTSKTGVQLTSEATGQIGSQKTLYDNTKTVSEQMTAVPLLVYNRIIEDLQGFGEDISVNYSKEDLETTAERCLQLAGNGVKQKGADIRSILSEELDIHESIARAKGLDVTISSRLSELEWTGTDTVLVGIGQGNTGTLLTPIAICRYIASLVNGGIIYQANIIDKIVDDSGNVVYDYLPTVVNNLDNVPAEYWEKVKEGMKEVISGEDHTTIAEAFNRLPSEYVSQIGGKTGTGQVTTNLELENNGCFVAFAPYDAPEICVVVLIPNGFSGTDAQWCAADVMKYYFDKKKATDDTSLPDEGVLTVK